ncbi:hypothetical protein ACIF8T_24815 [Streptomyces sp. NPDC085946]|uniref:hypothetical protein n=1 Tax=Streptomyces sp. NPDC085946 TaxID=3365744 RepID=UPI0037D535C3
MSDHGTVARQRRVTVLAPGCLIALMAPIVAVLIAALILMIAAHRQERTNERNEAEAAKRTEVLVRSYARAVMTASPYLDNPEVIHNIAEKHDGTLTSYRRSKSQLTTTVRFFGDYEYATIFGAEHSRAYWCYSVVFRKNAAGDLQQKITPLKKCHTSL